MSTTFFHLPTLLSFQNIILQKLSIQSFYYSTLNLSSSYSSRAYIHTYPRLAEKIYTSHTFLTLLILHLLLLLAPHSSLPLNYYLRHDAISIIIIIIIIIILITIVIVINIAIIIIIKHDPTKVVLRPLQQWPYEQPTQLALRLLFPPKGLHRFLWSSSEVLKREKKWYRKKKKKITGKREMWLGSNAGRLAREGGFKRFLCLRLLLLSRRGAGIAYASKNKTSSPPSHSTTTTTKKEFRQIRSSFYTTSPPPKSPYIARFKRTNERPLPIFPHLSAWAKDFFCAILTFLFRDLCI